MGLQGDRWQTARDDARCARPGRAFMRLALTALVVLLVAAPAAAQPAAPDVSRASEDERTRKARELFHDGAALSNAERWQDALEAFERSLALHPHAGTMYNMGFCERALSRYTRARKAFLQALERNAVQGTTELSASQMADAKRYLSEADGRIAKPVVTVEPADVHIAVNGRPLEMVATQGLLPIAAAGTRPPGGGEPAPAARFELWLDPGNHVFVLSRGESGRTVIDETFEPGQRGKLSLEWVPPPPFEDQTAGHGEQRDGSVRRAWGIGIGVAGLATLAVGGILGGVAAAKWSDAQDACPNGTRCPNDEAYEQSHDARLLGDLATIAFVTGGSALIGAAVVWFTAPDGPDEPAAGPDGAEAAGAVQLAPWVGPAAGGLAASGSF